MASIRRTLSPAYHDRSYQNGAISNSPLSSSPSHKLLTNGKYASSSPSPISITALAVTLRRFLFSRKIWRKSLYRCLVFFLVGLLLGLTPFGYVSDSRNGDLFSEITPPHVNRQFDSDSSDHLAVNRDGIVHTVSLSVEERNEAKRTVESEMFEVTPRKQLIVVTPTYNRAMQAYYLNRLAQTLSLVPPPVLWIVVETNAASFETAEMLRKTGVMYRHVVCKQNSSNVKDRGVHQRNAALEHIERHRLDGIVYFADDDNVYSLEILEGLREIRYLIHFFLTFYFYRF